MVRHTVPSIALRRAWKREKSHALKCEEYGAEGASRRSLSWPEVRMLSTVVLDIYKSPSKIADVLALCAANFFGQYLKITNAFLSVFDTSIRPYQLEISTEPAIISFLSYNTCF